MDNGHSFKTSLQWSNGRKGKSSVEGMPTIEVATPPVFPGGHPNIWSPEHLYIASSEVCFMTTFLAVAEKDNLNFLDYKSNAEGIVDRGENGLVVTKIVLYPKITIVNEEDRDKTLKLLEKSKRHCLISKSMKTDVTYEPTIEVAKSQFRPKNGFTKVS
jgi:peroxiredoxin-like protein